MVTDCTNIYKQQSNTGSVKTGLNQSKFSYDWSQEYSNYTKGR